MALSEALFGELFPAIVVGLVVVYSVIAGAIKANKNKKKQGKKPPITDGKADAPETAEKTPDEQFDEIVKKIETQRNQSNAAKHERQKERAQKQQDRYRYDSRNKVTSSDDTGGHTVVKEAFPKEKPAEAHHPHPAEAADKKVKVEKRPSAAGSMGDLTDEGCEEHGDLRFVLDEVASADEDTDADTRELQRLVVWGEVLNSPKFKRKH